MKRLLMFMCIGSFLVGCFSGQIKTRKDEFTGKTVATVNYGVVSSEEKNVFSDFNADFEFVREFDAKTEGSYVNVKIRGAVNAKDLESKCFIKVDDKTFDLFAGNRKSVNITEVTETTTYQADKAGAVDFTKGHKDTEISDQYKEMSGKIMLSNEFKDAILKGKSVLFRLYSGTDTATFKLSDEWVENLKKFYQTTGNEK
jgi:hypothetical protein